MKISKRKSGTEMILFIEPETWKQSNVFSEFARVNEPLTATVKHEHDYTYSHIEIRKKIL